MHECLGYTPRQITIAFLFSGAAASGITAISNPSSGDVEPTLTISVNRAGKGDRLPPLPPAKKFVPRSGLANESGTPENRESSQPGRRQPPATHSFPYRRA